MAAHEIKESESDSEISLLDILIFLKDTWKTIVFGGALGLAASGLNLLLTPNQYEAVANIQMVRIPAPNEVWKNIEEPASLITRMTLLNGLDNKVIEVCRVENQKDAATMLSKVVKFTIPKGSASVVELKVTLPTPELANTCASSILNLINKSQLEMISTLQAINQKTYQEELGKVDKRLAEDKSLINMARQPGHFISPTYFALMREIRTLEDRREKLLDLIDGKQMQDSTQQTSIYVSDKPIYPKKLTSLLKGAFGGLFLGFLVAVARQNITKLRAQGAL